MDVGLTVDICSCILFVVMIISHFRNKLWTIPDKIFFYMLITSIIAAATDSISIILNGRTGISSAFLQINSIIYFISRNMTVYVYICYIISVTIGWKIFCGSKKYVTALTAPIGAAVCIILSNPWTNFIFYYDKDNIYHRVPTMAALYITAALYMLLSLVLVQRFRDILTVQKRLALRSFFPILVLSVLLQVIFPNLTIEMFSTAICMLLIMFTIQRPEEIMDGVTGLWNRTAFMQDIQMYFQSGTAFSLINIDIENLKILNETIGFTAVSEILGDISCALRKHYAESDGLYNMENGIFNIVFLHKKQSNTERIAENLKERFEHNWSYYELELRLHAHITVLNCPADISDKNNLMAFTHNWDKAMLPFGRVLHYEDFDGRAIHRKKEVERKIEAALKEKKFQVYYQPIYSVKDQAFTSAEALIRLYDEELGFIPPDEFIPIAEENMSILKIGTYVLETVCEFIASGGLTQRGLRYVEVNLSVVQCMQADMAHQILEIIERYDIKPQQLNLEITETATLYSPDAMFKNMETLREHGILFSLDDYGSGYATLSYLLNFPFALIKLDKAIILACEPGSRKWIALKHTLEMLHEMNFQIVAEGVETKDSVGMLSSQDCHYLQGYYFSKALPQSEFLNFLDAHNPSFQNKAESLKV